MFFPTQFTVDTPSCLQFTLKACAALAIFSVCPGWSYLGNFAVTLCAPHFSELTRASPPTGAENAVTNNNL